MASTPVPEPRSSTRLVSCASSRVIAAMIVSSDLPLRYRVNTFPTPEEFAAFTKSEYAKFGKLVKDAGMQPE